VGQTALPLAELARAAKHASLEPSHWPAQLNAHLVHADPFLAVSDNLLVRHAQQARQLELLGKTLAKHVRTVQRTHLQMRPSQIATRAQSGRVPPQEAHHARVAPLARCLVARSLVQDADSAWQAHSLLLAV